MDNDLQVILPTGTRIKVQVNTFWLNIDITISSVDWKETDGLCGTYNDQMEDDFTNRKGDVVDQKEFMNSWK